MDDWGDYTKPGLTPAETAVRYILDRIRLDADLRYIMLDTQAMHLVCVAEAQRCGTPAEAVAEWASMPASANASREPRLKVYRDMRHILEEIIEDHDNPDRWGKDERWAEARQIIERADKAAR